VNAHRLAFVRERMSIPDTIQAATDDADVKAFMDLTAGKLGNVVVDATGNNWSMGRSLNFVGFAGRLVYVGITTQEISFAHPLMHRREMTLLASRNALS